MAAIAAIGLLVDAAETLVAREALAPAGLYSWRVLGLGRRYLVRSVAAAPLGWLFQYPQVLLLPTVQLICVPVLLSGFFLPSETAAPLIACAALTAAGARVLFVMRQQLGLDGADQMLLIVLLASGFGALLGNTPAGSGAVDYAALQLLLSYLIAGGAKAISPIWRSGNAIVGITGTIGYGHRWLHQLVSRNPLLARLVCLSVIVFECAAVPLLLLGIKGAWIVIIGGVCFHLGIAVVMGLNVFLWAFAATYPALLLLGTQIDSLLRQVVLP